MVKGAEILETVGCSGGRYIRFRGVSHLRFVSFVVGLLLLQPIILELVLVVQCVGLLELFGLSLELRFDSSLLCGFTWGGEIQHQLVSNNAKAAG